MAWISGRGLLDSAAPGQGQASRLRPAIACRPQRPEGGAPWSKTVQGTSFKAPDLRMPTVGGEALNFQRLFAAQALPTANRSRPSTSRVAETGRGKERDAEESQPSPASRYSTYLRPSQQPARNPLNASPARRFGAVLQADEYWWSARGLPSLPAFRTDRSGKDAATVTNDRRPRLHRISLQPSWGSTPARGSSSLLKKSRPRASTRPGLRCQIRKLAQRLFRERIEAAGYSAGCRWVLQSLVGAYFGGWDGRAMHYRAHVLVSSSSSVNCCGAPLLSHRMGQHVPFLPTTALKMAHVQTKLRTVQTSSSHA